MRIANRLVGFVLAAALLAGSVLAIVEIVAYALHADPVVARWPDWTRWASRTAWKATVIRVWAGLIAVLGLLLLIVELKPRRASRVPLNSATPATDAALTRKDLADSVKAAALDVDGIRAVTATVKRGRVRVAAAAATHDGIAAGTLKSTVLTATQARLDSLGLARPPRLSVRVASRSR